MNSRWMVRAATVTLVLLAAQLTGCGKKQTALTREEFRKATLGATLDDVRARFGPPDRVRHDGPEWVYEARTIDPATGQKDAWAALLHSDNRVTEVRFWPGPPAKKRQAPH